MISAKNRHSEGAISRVVLGTFVLCMCLVTNAVTFDKESKMRVRILTTSCDNVVQMYSYSFTWHYYDTNLSMQYNQINTVASDLPESHGREHVDTVDELVCVLRHHCCQHRRRHDRFALLPFRQTPRDGRWVSSSRRGARFTHCNRRRRCHPPVRFLLYIPASDVIFRIPRQCLLPYL